MFKIIFFL